MLNELAAERRRAIAQYLVRQKGLDSKRVFILGSQIEMKASEHGVVALLLLRAS